MSEEKPEAKSAGRFDSSSKFWKVFLVIVAAALTFVGPTYVVYVLVNLFELDYFVSMVSGLALFIVGFVLVLYLIRTKVIS